MRTRDKKFLILLYHIIVGCAQPKRRVTIKRISLKYRFRHVPYEGILTPETMDRLDKVLFDTHGKYGFEKNKDWYIKFANKCRMEYAFM